MKLVLERLWDGSPARPEERVELSFELGGEELRIEVDAPWHGDPAPTGRPGPTAALWETEVVELFLLGPDGPRRPYTEIELGPHGHHLVLRLEGVRNPIADQLPIAYSATRVGARWTGVAQVARELLPDRLTHFNAFAIHGLGADRRYLAHSPVPGDAPDFHRLGLFPAMP